MGLSVSFAGLHGLEVNGGRDTVKGLWFRGRDLQYPEPYHFAFGLVARLKLGKAFGQAPRLVVLDVSMWGEPLGALLPNCHMTVANVLCIKNVLRAGQYLPR